MKMVEVDNMIVDELGTLKQIAHDSSAVRNADAQGVLNCPHGADGVDCCADPADALCEDPRIPWVTPSQNQLQTPKHGPGAPGISYVAILYLGLYT
jgi:hypothetical protein